MIITLHTTRINGILILTIMHCWASYGNSSITWISFITHCTSYDYLVFFFFFFDCFGLASLFINRMH
ncbi:uncharacterized protein ASPGLDRAFT_1414100 [Aspergillus glaucus CBS 516.65]|uniref:Uncharacterized protein n=1 Tax=Aspergillus glaucus CBS 516.65 TaxID=1160497 RepID=A0A1L9VMD2_ASPGL|nr:hypothetical protein ASPGLDRAFT_1414100 [Aspergillus glaucus CBS 516.65]OJJ85065.1 hypothetical protein ASPGLDRAFT_1414100 [Aspergillus glaucus CBS 516.65]